MKIGFYSPYFDSLGGGERYIFALASHWSRKHHVFIFCDDEDIISRAEDRFGLDLSRVSRSNNVFLSLNRIKKYVSTYAFDLMFFLSDGSIPLTFAKKNILHFQIPFPKIKASKIKLKRYQTIVVNSCFTRDNLDKSVGKKAVVIYPPVDTKAFNKTPKTNTILSVGRLTKYQNAKKQDVLISAFKSASKKGFLKNYKLIFAGGLIDSDRGYYDSLVAQAAGSNIEFFPNIPFENMKSLYQTAKIYWHAAGFGESNPMLFEHFGISTVEAMASGCVPVVFRGGGLPEIIEDESQGFLWESTDELLEITKKLTSDKDLLARLSANSQARSAKFNNREFFKAFDRLL